MDAQLANGEVRTASTNHCVLIRTAETDKEKLEKEEEWEEMGVAGRWLFREDCFTHHSLKLENSLVACCFLSLLCMCVYVLVNTSHINTCVYI